MQIFLSTLWTLQIVAVFKATLLPNYKTYRNSEDRFGILEKSVTKTI